jgi:hypothetical protein
MKHRGKLLRQNPKARKHDGDKRVFEKCYGRAQRFSMRRMAAISGSQVYSSALASHIIKTMPHTAHPPFDFYLLKLQRNLS